MVRQAPHVDRRRAKVRLYDSDAEQEPTGPSLHPGRYAGPAQDPALNDLLQGILYQVSGLLGAVNSFLAVVPESGVLDTSQTPIESFVATMEDDMELIIRAGTGRFSDNVNWPVSSKKTRLASSWTR